LMDAYETGAAAGVNGHAGTGSVVIVRQPICHNGNAVSRGSIARLIVGVPETYLLVI
jgi:hypothetical protein